MDELCPSQNWYDQYFDSLVKNPPAMQETWVQFLGQEDLLEKEMATHSCVLAWEIPWTEEPGGLQCIGSRNQTGLSDQTTTTTNPQYLRMWLYLDHIVLVKKKKKINMQRAALCSSVYMCKLIWLNPANKQITCVL